MILWFYINWQNSLIYIILGFDTVSLMSLIKSVFHEHFPTIFKQGTSIKQKRQSEPLLRDSAQRLFIKHCFKVNFIIILFWYNFTILNCHMITCIMHKISVFAKEDNLAELCNTNIHQDIAQTTASKYLAACKILTGSHCTKNNLLACFMRSKEITYVIYNFICLFLVASQKRLFWNSENVSIKNADYAVINHCRKKPVKFLKFPA